MMEYIKEGWKAALRQPFLLVALFVYRFAWGFVLYRLVQSVVVPLLHRYPGQAVSQEQVRLFLAESEFQLTKTDISHKYIWLLLALLLARMLLTPLLNAGVYYSLQHTDLNTGYRFFRGIKELGRTFFFYYLLQIALTLAPVALLWPQLRSMAEKYAANPSGLLTLLPWAAAFLAYGFALRLIFMHLQFGKTRGSAWLRSLAAAMAGALPIVAVALLLLLLSGLVSSIILAATMIWAGFWALLLYQLSGIIRVFFCLWGITSQRELFAARANRF